MAVPAGDRHRLQQAVQHGLLGRLHHGGEVVVQRAAGDGGPGRHGAARRAQPRGQGQEDLPARVVRGAADPGQAQPGPAGQPLAGGRVQRPVGEHHHDARARGARPGRSGPGTWPRPGGIGQQAPGRHPGHREPLPVAEVGHRDHPDRRPAGNHPGCGPDPALVAQAAHPGSRADRALSCGTRPGGRPGRCQRLPHVVPLHLHRAVFAEKTVVALGHDRDDDVLGTDRRLLAGEQLAGRVIHPAQLHGRGQEHGRLGQPPFLRGQHSGAFAGPVEHRAAGRHGEAEQVAARVYHRHPGSCRAPAGRRRRLVPPYGGVSQPGPGDVEHRPGRARWQQADGDAKIRSARHPAMVTAAAPPGEGAREPAGSGGVERGLPAA